MTKPSTMKVRTEIDAIREALVAYQNPRSMTEFITAQTYLNKVHDKYGTVDLGLIKSLLN